MTEPIKSKRLSDLAGAPTPQNTPSTAVSSFASRAAQQPTVSTIKEEDTAAAVGNLVSNPALLSMIEGRLNGLVGASSGYIESLPQIVKDRISALKAVQNEHAKLEADFQKELLELEKKYFAKYEPLYARRAEIVNGVVEPTEDEIKVGKEIEKEEEAIYHEGEEEEEEEEEEAKEEEAKEDQQDIKGIPEFWLTALKNLIPIADTIQEQDDDALKYLVDIRMKYLDNPGFALEFEFKENPYFTNQILTKSYFYQEETGYGGDFIYDHADGDKINWKSKEKNLCVKFETRKQRNKHTKATRTIEKALPIDSFFNFFSPPKAPKEDEEEENEEIAAALEDGSLEERLEADYQLGEEIKEKLIPRAVDWFTGAALEYEGLDDVDDEDFEGLLDSEDANSDDSDDSEEESEEEEVEEGGKTTKEKPECNQQ